MKERVAVYYQTLKQKKKRKTSNNSLPSPGTVLPRGAKKYVLELQCNNRQQQYINQNKRGGGGDQKEEGNVRPSLPTLFCWVNGVSIRS